MNILTKASVAGVLAAGLLTGCGSGSSSHAGAPSPASSSSSPAAATAPLAPAATPTLSAQQVADHGLPSKVGAGKLSTPTLKRLVQYFEDKVSRAYATGNVDALSHYLAGPMLSGNRATIGLLNSKNKRNVFRIRVQSVTPQSNQAHAAIVEMTGDMTVNYFFNPRTHKVLDNGLPGPSQVRFIIFLNQNPATGTWYWTGEKADTSSSSGSSGTVG
jgi:hypothetical protein